MKYRVMVTDNLSAAGVDALKSMDGLEVDVRETIKEPAELRKALADYDGIILRSATKLTPEILEGQKRLKVAVRAGVGVDNIDQAAATREGIVVMNTPAGNTTSTAEHTIAMMMALSRNIGPASGGMREGKWDRKKYTGTQLSGKTLAIIGLGRIGLSVAKRAQGLEMKTIGQDPMLAPEKAAEEGVAFIHDIDELVSQCDYLTVHTPLNDKTRGIINAARLKKMKKSARIINCARGGIIDEDALAAAIESGQIAGAALDVFVNEPPGETPLTKLEQVLCTPHLGASTDEAQELVAIEAAEIISGFLLRNEIRHAVNMVPISGAEMADMKQYLNLGHRLGLLLGQLSPGGSVKSVNLQYRGEVASKKTDLITSAFTAGLLEKSLDDSVNIVNAKVVAEDRGIEINENKTSEPGNFSTVVGATLITEQGEISAAGTLFGTEFLRLVRLDQYHLDAYLDGLLLIYRHRDQPGQIGFIGTVFGKHGVNIAHMALGRESNQQGGSSIAVLNLDNAPSKEAIKEVATHHDVSSVELVHLPPAGEPLPWLVSS